MNDPLFFVADADMREAISGFLGRASVDRVIGCRRFDFDARRDIKVANEHDPGLYTRANELLRPFAGTYRHVVLVIDEDWGGSPGAERIRERLDEHLTEIGWPPPEGLGLVVQPEVDIWLWSDSPHSATAMGWRSWDELRPALTTEGWLNEGQVKPEQPKEAAEWALRKRQIRRSPALYRKIAEAVSIRRCEDRAVECLLETLRRWFPAEEGT
ncbi:methylation-associated defense system protein MAD4 [Nannocystaceae bacterium ST9]